MSTATGNEPLAPTLALQIERAHGEAVDTMKGAKLRRADLRRIERIIGRRKAETETAE